MHVWRREIHEEEMVSAVARPGRKKGAKECGQGSFGSSHKETD